MICPKCGAVYSQTAAFCANCGTKLQAENSAQPASQNTGAPRASRPTSARPQTAPQATFQPKQAKSQPKPAPQQEIAQTYSYEGPAAIPVPPSEAQTKALVSHWLKIGLIGLAASLVIALTLATCTNSDSAELFTTNEDRLAKIESSDLTSEEKLDNLTYDEKDEAKSMVWLVNDVPSFDYSTNTVTVEVVNNSNYDFDVMFEGFVDQSSSGNFYELSDYFKLMDDASSFGPYDLKAAAPANSTTTYTLKLADDATDINTESGDIEIVLDLIVI